MSETEHEHPEQEPDAPSGKWITIVAIGTVVLTAALSLIAVGLVADSREDLGAAEPQGAQHSRAEWPVDEELEFHLFEFEEDWARARDRRRLESFAWVDREAGLVRVPIDVAMDLIAARQGQP